MTINSCSSTTQWFFFTILYQRENWVTERFNSQFLRDHQVARPMDLYNKVDWPRSSLPRYLVGVQSLCYSILSDYILNVLLFPLSIVPMKKQFWITELELNVILQCKELNSNWVFFLRYSKIRVYNFNKLL